MKISKIIRSCTLLLPVALPTAMFSSCSIFNKSFNVVFNGDIDYVNCTNKLATVHKDFTTQIEPKDETFEIEKIEVKVDNIFLDEKKYKWDYENLIIPGKYITSTNLSIHIIAYKKNIEEKLNVSFEGKYAQLINYEGYLHHQFHSQIIVRSGWTIKDASITVGNKTLICNQDYHITNEENYCSLTIKSAALSLKDVTIHVISSKSFHITSNHEFDPNVTWTEQEAWVEYDFKTKIKPTQEDQTVNNFIITNGSHKLVPINDYYYNYATSELCIYGSSIIEDSLNIDFEIKDIQTNYVNIFYFDAVAESILFLSPISDEPILGREFKAKIVEELGHQNAIKSIDDIQIYLNGVAIEGGYSFDAKTRIITLNAETMCSSYVTIISKSSFGEVSIKTNSSDIRIEKTVDFAGSSFSTRITQLKEKKFELSSFYVQTKDGSVLLSSQYLWNSDSNIFTITDVSLLVDGAEFIIEPTFVPKCLSAYAETAFDVSIKYSEEGSPPSRDKRPPMPDCQVTTDSNLNNWKQLKENEVYHVDQGKTLYFKGDNPKGWLNFSDVSEEWKHPLFADYCTCAYSISFTHDENTVVNLDGNIISLIDDGKCEMTRVGKDLADETAYWFMGLFKDNPSIRTAPYFPFTIGDGYRGLFKEMFQDCVNLIGPSNSEKWILPTKVVRVQTYECMFRGCTNLVESPIIFAHCGEIITIQPFAFMFQGCSSLRLINTLLKNFGSTSLEKESFRDWTDGVPEDGQFKCCMKASDVERGTWGVPEKWEVVSGASSAFDYMAWDEVITTVKDGGVNALKETLGLSHDDSLINYSKTLLFNSIPHRVRIVGENVDTTDDDTKTNLTFEFTTLISDENGKVILRPWNDDIFSTNQWIDDQGFSCSLRSFLNQYVWSNLPLELKATNVILPVKKSTGKGNGSLDCAENVERIWIMSHDEIGGWKDDEACLHNEGSIYSGVYEEAQDDVTPHQQWTKRDFRGEKYKYWLRSPTTLYGFDEYSAWAVNSFDDLLLSSSFVFASNFGVAPCFCI